MDNTNNSDRNKDSSLVHLGAIGGPLYLFYGMTIIPGKIYLILLKLLSARLVEKNLSFQIVKFLAIIEHMFSGHLFFCNVREVLIGYY